MVEAEPIAPRQTRPERGPGFGEAMFNKGGYLR